MPRLVAYLRSLDPRLPRSVWLLQVGGLANSFGSGLVFPFIVIYLHDARGFELGLAGSTLAVGAFFQLGAGVLVGTILDRIGGRITLSAALVMQAVAWSLFPLVREPWHAFALIALDGIGVACFWPGQSTLLVRLTPPERRHAAYAQQRLTMNLGIGLGGLVGGLILHGADAGRFTLLFLIDAVTFLVFAFVVLAVREPPVPAEERSETRGGYRVVLRDRVFLGLVVLNVAFVTFGYAMLTLLPAFAKQESDIGEGAIGVVFFVNTIVIVLAQLPIARLVEGRRRLGALALMCVLWCGAWLLVAATGGWLTGVAAAALLCVALGLFGIGECLQGPTQPALVADLAPPSLRGRYFALATMSWGVGFVVGPAAGGFVLEGAPLALWPAAAALCLVAGAGALALERHLPPELRRTPRATAEPPEPPVLAPTGVEVTP